MKSGKLAVDDEGESELTATVAEFGKADTLPGAKLQASAADGYCQRDPSQCCLDVGWHIVKAFECMGQEGKALGHDVVECGLQVFHYRGVGVFVD